MSQENRTALEECTHLYDDAQGTIKHKHFLTPDEDTLSKALLFNCSWCFVV